MNDVITEKRRLWKVWKNGGSKENYPKAKKVVKRAVFTTKRKVLDDKFGNKDDVALFRIACSLVKDDDNKLPYSDIAKKNESSRGMVQQLYREFV